MKVLKNRETLRRLALSAGLILSIMLYTHSVGVVYVVQKPDFKQMKEADAKKKQRAEAFVKRTITQRPGSVSPELLKTLRQQQAAKKPAKPISLDEYVAGRIRGQTKELSGTQWRSAWRSLLEHFQGKTPEDWLVNTANDPGIPGSLYFPARAGPFARVAPKIHQELFLTCEDCGPPSHVLLQTIYGKNARDARASLLHPWRSYSWAPLTMGLLLYLFLIPKVKRPATAMGYGRLWGVMISDFFSLLFGGVFFLLGFLALWEHHASIMTFFSLDTGPMILTLVLWLMGLLCLGGMWLGISYRNFWIRILPQGMEMHTHQGGRLYLYKNMKRAELRIKDYGWMVKLTLLLGWGDPGTMAMAMAMKDNVAESLVVELGKGETWRFKANRFDGLPAVAEALKNNGVEIDDGLAALLEMRDISDPHE